MMSGNICNHIYFLHSEVLRFYLGQMMAAEGVDPYTLEDDEFKEGLKKIIDKIKKAMNIDMNDLLEQYEEQYLERRKMFKTCVLHDINQNQ